MTELNTALCPVAPSRDTPMLPLVVVLSPDNQRVGRVGAEASCLVLLFCDSSQEVQAG